MSKPTHKPTSPLAASALALAEELERFEVLTESAHRIALTSQKNLERAAQNIQDAASCQVKVGEHLQAFMQALNAAREQNAATAERLKQRSEEIGARSQVLGSLTRRFGELGQEAASISSTVAEVAHRQGPEPPLTTLGEIETRLEKLAEQAATLLVDAREGDAPDLVSQVDSLKQQVQSARNKVKLLVEKLRGAGPSN